MESLHTLKVLMWKHCIVRIRRYIFTTLEFTFPTVCFLLLFLNREYISPKPRSFHMEKYNVHNTDPLPLSDIPPPTRIYYSPESNFTATLMDMVSEQLYPKQQSYRELGRKTDAIAVSSYEDLLRSNAFLERDVAIVNFSDVGGDQTMPGSLNYTIRMNGNFYVGKMGTNDDDVKPHENYGRAYQEFMRLQWAIDSSYIKMLTGNEIKQRVTLQEFPFVARASVEGASMVSALAAVLCWMSLVLPFLSLVGRLVEERLSGIQALLKLAGVSAASLRLSHLLNMLPVGLVFCVFIPIMMTASSQPLVPNSSATVMALFLMLHFFTMMAIAFILSTLFRSTQYVSSMTVYVYVLLRLPLPFLPKRVTGAALALGLLPNVPLYWYWIDVAVAEAQDTGVTFGTLTHYEPGAASPLLCLVFLLLQLLLLAPFAYYVRWCRRARDRVGSCSDLLAWCRGKRQVSAQRLTLDEPLEETRDSPGAEYFEAVPEDKVVGVSVVNVTKVYKNQAVLKNVSLDIYQGEITVLLGHNGAGKTTLMSIITGMTAPTSGHVTLADVGEYTDARAAQRRIGLCPQHNLFLPMLTVLEHVMFFTMLKGSSYSKAKKSSIALLEQLGIADKASKQSGELSGGMKRRLQLACALAGDCAVLILDEPTAGLDVETRRELWDLLLSLRGSRTVLISTHFMEEADALGDRVAALHDGALRCHATTMHLKRTVGTGYRLSFTTIGDAKEGAITALVTTHVPDAVLKGASHNALTYALPAKRHESFPKLFAALEAARPQLGIDTIGVGVSTIEEVFLKLCSDTNMTITEDELDASAVEPTYIKLSGARLYCNQLAVLFRRQLRFLCTRKLAYFRVYWILTFLVAFLITLISNDEPQVDETQRELPLTLDLYAARVPDARVLVGGAGGGASLRAVEDGYPHVTFQRADDQYNTILEVARAENSYNYARYVAGIEINDTDAKVMYSTVYPHTAPVALNLLTSALAAQGVPWASAHLLTTRNHPLQLEPAVPRIERPKEAASCVIWSTCVVFLCMATITECLSMAIKERVSGARRIYVMAGCPPELFWLATLLTHVFVYGATLVAAPLVTAALKDADNTLTQPDFLATMALVLVLGMAAYLPVGYLLTYRFSERATSMLLFAFVFVFGVITPALKTAADVFQESQHSVSYYVLHAVSVTAPPHTFTAAAARAVSAARLNALCTLNRARCPALGVLEDGFDPVKCCAMQNPSSYFSTDDASPLWPMLCLAAQSVFFMILVFVTERGYFNLLCDRVCNAGYRPRADDAVEADAMAVAERAYVGKAITLPDDQIAEVMLVDDIHKNYPACFEKACNAVRGVSFSVKRGECFGLLGVNGAGKSSTFKMLTADETVTRGAIFANGQRLDYRRPLDKYMQSFGYCPQFFGVEKFLSGVENLRTVLSMRGLAPADARREALSWIQVVGLDKYAHAPAARYSGGCARRLATAAALCGGARVTLLDEPSAGVDVGARRRVWAAVRRAQRSRRSLVVSSHSMEEMEALCARIAIMSRGRVRALGAAAALRAAHAAGHAVRIKLRAQRGDVTDAGTKPPPVQQLKSAFHRAFDCTLKDEHTTMLHFHINETLSYSELFGALEALQRDHGGLVEDYCVTETTLEEVFLAFAREAQDRPATV